MCKELGISTSAIVFSPLEDGQTLSADCLAHEEHSINISFYCYYYSNATVWRCIDQQCQLHYDYISVWTQDNHISRRKCRNYIYLFQIIYFKEPIHQEDWQPSFDESMRQVQGQPSKIGGSLGASPQQEGSWWTVSSSPYYCCSTVQGPSFVHCRWHQDVPWLSVLFPAPGCLPFQYLIHVVYSSLVLYLLCY